MSDFSDFYVTLYTNCKQNDYVPDMEKQKVTSHRVEPSVIQKVKQLWGTASKGHAMADHAYVNIRPVILAEIERAYSTGMIAVVAELLRGSGFDARYAVNKDVLLSKLKAAKQSESDPEKKSNLLLVMERIRTSSAVECYFLQEEIHRRLAMKS